MTVAYVAYHDCGNIVAATVGVPENGEEMGKSGTRKIARWIRRGDRVERMEVEEARKAQWCQCFRGKGKEKARQMPQEVRT